MYLLKSQQTEKWITYGDLIKGRLSERDKKVIPVDAILSWASMRAVTLARKEIISQFESGFKLWTIEFKEPLYGIWVPVFGAFLKIINISPGAKVFYSTALGTLSWLSVDDAIGFRNVFGDERRADLKCEIRRIDHA